MWFLFLALALSAAAVKCPVGSMYSSDYNSCYLVSNTNDATWTAAESICNIMGGHLLSIENQQQNDFILKFVENSSDSVFGIWIGANAVIGGTWQNSDGTHFNYSNFAGGSPPPASLNHSVVYMITGNPGDSREGVWEEVEESQYVTTHFVCQLPPCNANGSAPASLLTPNQPKTGLFYGNQTNAWYFGSRLIENGDSESNCKVIGGRLPSIHNAFQNAQFRDIGIAFGFETFDRVPLGYQSDANGVWSWSDGSNSTYTTWAPKQPYAAVSQYTTFSMSDGTWYSEYFDKDQPEICEWNDDGRKGYC